MISALTAHNNLLNLLCIDAAALKKNDAYIQEIIVKEQQQLRNSETSVGAVIKMNQEPTKRSQMSVLCVLNWYAYNLLALVLSGGFAVLPALSLGGIFARINAHTRLPQFTAMLILLVFYLTDFALVSYVPKFTFVSHFFTSFWFSMCTMLNSFDQLY